MTTKQKLDIILKFLKINHDIYKTRELKNESIKNQDFQTAANHRDTEKKLMEEYLNIGSEVDKLLNINQP
jgi:protein-arginine kinase activator protein McsA